MSLDENALLKNMISGIDVNDGNKVPSSAYIHSLVERIGMGTALEGGFDNLTAGLNSVNNNLSNVKQSITQLNGYKVSFYGIFDKTLEELYNLSKTNTACYIGFIDWRQSEITISNGTIIWFACNWVVFAISGSGLYVLDGSTMAWKKTS